MPPRLQLHGGSGERLSRPAAASLHRTDVRRANPLGSAMTSIKRDRRGRPVPATKRMASRSSAGAAKAAPSTD